MMSFSADVSVVYEGTRSMSITSDVSVRSEQGCASTCQLSVLCTLSGQPIMRIAMTCSSHVGNMKHHGCCALAAVLDALSRC